MHPTSEDLRRFVQGVLTPEEASQIVAHLGGCLACSNQLGEMLRDQSSQDAQLPSAAGVTSGTLVQVRTLDTAKDRLYGVIVARSVSGLVLRLGQTLPAGILVLMRSKDEVFMGDVLACLATGNQFEAKIRLHHVSRLSSGSV